MSERDGIYPDSGANEKDTGQGLKPRSKKLPIIQAIVATPITYCGKNWKSSRDRSNSFVPT